MGMFLTLTTLSLLSLTVGISVCFAVANEFSSIITYLAKYQYLPSSDLETNQLRSDTEVVEAIKDLQFMGGLIQTGELDHNTVELMKTPRCGIPDNARALRQEIHFQRHPVSAAALASARRRGKRYSLFQSRWEKSEVTYMVTNYTFDLSQDQVRHAIRVAFSAWSAVIPIAFREVQAGPNIDSRYVDMRIKFAEGYHDDGAKFDGEGGVLAHAFPPGHDLGGDTHFDDAEKWVVSPTERGTFLPFVAVHEFGHALGLGHTSVRGSIMFPWYSRNASQGTFRLGPDDIDGVTALYGRKQSSGGMDVTMRPILPPVATSKRPLVTWGVPPWTTTTTATMKPQPGPTQSTDYTPNQCYTSFDSISIIRNEVMIFKKQFFWRVKQDGSQIYPKPINISSFFFGLPPVQTWTEVDAVFEHKNNDIVFFLGKRYFLFDGSNLKRGFPKSGKPITDYGLPASLDKVDTVFRWGLNGMMYIISSGMYWKYDEMEKAMFPDYPRDMSMWGGVQLPVDAAFTSFNGKSYFFRNLKYWELDNKKMVVAAGYPRWSNTHWLGCPEPKLNFEVDGSSRGFPMRCLLMNSVLAVLFIAVVT